jgi:hypothetical protein
VLFRSMVTYNAGAEVLPQPDIPAPEAPAAPDVAAPSTPITELSSVSVAQEVQEVAQPLTGPDITTLSEQGSGIAGIDNPQIINLYRNAVARLASMASVVDKPLEQRKKLYDDFFDLDAQLTDFFESSSLGKAMIQETLKADQAKQAAQHSAVTAARLKLQTVDPDAVTKKKEKLKEILASCDGEITKMREIELEAHKNAMNIVNQNTLQAAEAMSNKVNQQAQELTTRAQNVTEKIARDFQVNAQEVLTLLRTFKESLRNLQDSWAQAQAIDEAALKAAAVSAAQPVTSVTPAQPQPVSVPQTVQPVIPAQESFAHYVLRRMTDIALGAWDVMQDTYQWFLERMGYATPPSKKS